MNMFTIDHQNFDTIPLPVPLPEAIFRKHQKYAIFRFHLIGKFQFLDMFIIDMSTIDPQNFGTIPLPVPVPEVIFRNHLNYSISHFHLIGKFQFLDMVIIKMSTIDPQNFGTITSGSSSRNNFSEVPKM